MDQLTVVILTLNEATNLSACLAAIPSRYPVVLVDSGSVDETVALARSSGCQVIHHDWMGFAAQRNFALDCCEITTPWILFIDADERYTSEWFEWFDRSVTLLNQCDVVLVPSRLFIRQSRLDHAPGYPIYHPRLVRRTSARFHPNATGHGEAVSDDLRFTRCSIPYDHYFFDGDIVQWALKHVRLASVEWRTTRATGILVTPRARLSLLLGRSVARVPARFMYHYILRRGFLDGRNGLQYSLMYTWFEGTKYLMSKVNEGRP